MVVGPPPTQKRNCPRDFVPYSRTSWELMRAGAGKLSQDPRYWPRKEHEVQSTSTIAPGTMPSASGEFLVAGSLAPIRWWPNPVLGSLVIQADPGSIRRATLMEDRIAAGGCKVVLRSSTLLSLEVTDGNKGTRGSAVAATVKATVKEEQTPARGAQLNLPRTQVLARNRLFCRAC